MHEDAAVADTLQPAPESPKEITASPPTRPVGPSSPDYITIGVGPWILDPKPTHYTNYLTIWTGATPPWSSSVPRSSPPTRPVGPSTMDYITIGVFRIL